MRIIEMMLVIVAAGCFSCGPGSASKPDTTAAKPSSSTTRVQSNVTLSNFNKKHIDTEYEYSEYIGTRLIIQNSLPKGDLLYTDTNGKEYRYAVFWTRIINETLTPYELTIDFASNSYQLPSSPGNKFKFIIYPDTVTPDKADQYNYGLTNLNQILHTGLRKQSLLTATINPKKSTSFYVVALSERGIGGALRTGFSLKDKKINYRVNEKNFICGSIKTLN